MARTVPSSIGTSYVWPVRLSVTVSVSAAVATPPPLLRCSSVPMDLLCAHGPSRARHVSSWLERRPASPGTKTAIRPATMPSARRPASGSADSRELGAARRLAASKAPTTYPLRTSGEPGSGGDDGRGHRARDEEDADPHHAAGLALGGREGLAPDGEHGDEQRPAHEQATRDVERDLRGLLGGERDQRHGAGTYRTEGRPS